jgi:hypothetical protein
MVSITSIKKWLDAFFTLVMFQIIELLQRQLVICIQIQMLEHPPNLTLA